MSETETKSKYGVDPEIVPDIEALRERLDERFGIKTRFIRIMNMLLREALDARKQPQIAPQSIEKD